MSATVGAPSRHGGRLQIGVFVPQGWKLEYRGWSGPDAWNRSVELALLAESLGYDSLWVLDRLLYPVAPRLPYPASPDGSLPRAYRRRLPRRLGE